MLMQDFCPIYNKSLGIYLVVEEYSTDLFAEPIIEDETAL